MHSRTVLITGGAGFIGSHLADELLARGYRVRALDVLDPQVHGLAQRRPEYLSKDVDLCIGDVRHPETVQAALEGVEAVFHFAAAVGVGQSMYEVSRYVSVNCVGTSVLVECLAKRKISRLVVASSMSVYGEGLLHDARGEDLEAPPRSLEQLARAEWELQDPHGERATPVPTPETKHVSLESIYALSKYDQERICMMLGRAYRIPTVALRFFNVYGPRQALSNPYTGVLAIFAARLLHGKRPIVFEDGRQRRDFVSVHDVARACVLALESGDAPGHVFNVGSGEARTIEQVARTLAEVLGKADLAPDVINQYRMGDVRHCFADIALARRVLRFAPCVSFRDGIAEFVQWLAGQDARDRSFEARAELEARGLTV